MEVGKVTGKNDMTRKEILSTIKTLAGSQGLYGRLLRDIKVNDEILDELEAQGFKTPLDMVMFIEC